MPIATINPATGELVRAFNAAGDDEIERALTTASTAARAWRRTPLTERTKVIGAAGDLLDARGDQYARLMTLEMGKTIRAARDEAAKCAKSCRYFADHAAVFLGDERLPIEGEESVVAFEPLGVVLAVMPWNFPFWQVIRFAAPALAAGNVGLLKHASNVPQCALALASLFRDAGAPDGVFQTLLVGSDRVEGLLADARIAAATVTGSTQAGASVAAAAGRHLKKTVLELGGSDPFIVMPSADLDLATATAVNARIINNGQSCIAAKRFIVHQSIVDRFIDGFVRRVGALKVGDPMRDDTDVGPLATKQIRDDLDRQVRDSIAAGARCLVGGRPREGAGFYYEPTVLVDVPPNAPAFREETFGPLAAIVPVSSIDEAIRVANDTAFGLGASAWTNDPIEATRFTREIEAGTISINAMVASDARIPFGGVKGSGYGRELSAFGMREFVNIKTIRRPIRGVRATSKSE